MSLLQLKSYLEKNRFVNLHQITQHFNVDPDITRDMLKHFIRKGQLKTCQKTNNCGSGCTRCSPLLTELYQWCGRM